MCKDYAIEYVIEHGPDPIRIFGLDMRADKGLLGRLEKCYRTSPTSSLWYGCRNDRFYAV